MDGSSQKVYSLLKEGKRILAGRLIVGEEVYLLHLVWMDEKGEMNHRPFDHETYSTVYVEELSWED
ncbi:MAG: hypothetical protein LIO90_10895 [Bacteroidales bacterium]|nr:hypothetical protein [Bacteroidales bacterium]